MLRIFNRLSQLNWSQLMAVYAEGVAENGAELYPNLSEGQQILRAEQDFHAYLSGDFFRNEQEKYCIWEENGRYVSALRLHPFEDGVLMEALETHPDYRRRGYAASLIREVIAQLHLQKVYSHIRKRNMPSIAVHQKCGFRKISDSARYLNGEVTTRSQTYLYEQ